VKLADLKPGDKLVADDGFPCIGAGRRCTVQEDGHGFFVTCRGPDGKLPRWTAHHYLDGQEDEPDGDLVGLAYAPKVAAGDG
jgi:hypothetical protein